MVSAGFRAHSFASGAEFFESLHAERPDCVVLDLHMPVMSGFDVQLRLGVEKLAIPIVVITGHDTPEAQQRALRAGASAYLPKPIGDEALLGAVAMAIATNSQECG